MGQECSRSDDGTGSPGTIPGTLCRDRGGGHPVLVFSLFFPARRLLLSRENGVLFGVGWGGVESIIVALLVLQSMILFIVFVSGNSGMISAILTDPQQLAAVGTLSSLTPLDIIPGLFERIMTITLHIAFTLLVLYSVVRLEWRFLLAAIAWHGSSGFRCSLHRQVIRHLANRGNTGLECHPGPPGHTLDMEDDGEGPRR